MGGKGRKGGKGGKGEKRKADTAGHRGAACRAWVPILSGFLPACHRHDAAHSSRQQTVRQRQSRQNRTRGICARGAALLPPEREPTRYAQPILGLSEAPVPQ